MVKIWVRERHRHVFHDEHPAFNCRLVGSLERGAPGRRKRCAMVAVSRSVVSKPIRSLVIGTEWMDSGNVLTIAEDMETGQ